MLRSCLLSNRSLVFLCFVFPFHFKGDCGPGFSLPGVGWMRTRVDVSQGSRPRTLEAVMSHTRSRTNIRGPLSSSLSEWPTRCPAEGGGSVTPSFIFRKSGCDPVAYLTKILGPHPTDGVFNSTHTPRRTYRTRIEATLFHDQRVKEGFGK